MEITLNAPKDVTVTPAVTKNITSLTVLRLVDLPSEKKVVAFFNEIGRVVLWEGAAYDAIGQWTDTDVSNRVKALYA